MTKRRLAKPGPAIRSRLRVVYGKDVALGPGRVELLERIAETGSLRAAAAAMSMSYMRAWTLMKSLNGWFDAPLVARTRGGRAGGGAVLTESGRIVVAVYRRMERQSQTAIQPGWKRLRRLLKTP